MNTLCKTVCLQTFIIIVGSGIASAQKVKVGYDKSVDFSKYKTFSVVEPAMPPTHPMAYATVIKAVMDELSAKGLRQVNTEGDLTVVPAGGVEYGNNAASPTPIIGTYSGPLPATNATMWTGAQGPTSLAGSMVPQGTLVLEFVDRTANSVVWSGSVTEKLDIEQKDKSLDRIRKAVVKLLQRYPPKR